MTESKIVFDVERVREDFPALNQKINDNKLVYLDNAATTLKPKTVIEEISKYYSDYSGNVHRGVHSLSERATEKYEGVRKKVQALINARDRREVIFTSGTTAAINFIALGYAQNNLKPGDEIIVSVAEHHSNIVPWQMLCNKTGCILKTIPINTKGELDLEEYRNLLNDKTKIVAIYVISNSLGSVNPVKLITKLAHEYGAITVVDAAQAIQHLKIDVKEMDCDFLTFSAHKLYGPTGVGVLYGRLDVLQKVEPVFGGGDMIYQVDFDKTTYAELPNKLEAGTPNIAGVIGLGAAIDYIRAIGIENIARWESQLLEYAHSKLSQVEGLTIIGTAAHKASVVSFTLDGVHPHDIGSILDSFGIAVRAGHHCAQPVMKFFKVPATARASFSFYNTFAEIDLLVKALNHTRRMMT